MNTGRF